MPDQGPDLPDPDQWLEDFKSKLLDIPSLFNPSGRTGVPGLLGSRQDIETAIHGGAPQNPASPIGVTGLPGSPQIGQVATDNQGVQQYFTGYDHSGNQVWNPMGVRSDGPDAFGVTETSPLLVTAPNPHPGSLGETVADIAGKIWGAPNTALGLGLAGAGYLAGKMAGTNPQFQFGNNALQLTGIPIGNGAVTIGNVQLYGGGATPDTPGQHYVPGLPDMSLGVHEEGHTRQSQALGPAYLPLWFALGMSSSENPLERSADLYGAGRGGPFSGF